MITTRVSCSTDGGSQTSCRILIVFLRVSLFVFASVPDNWRFLELHRMYLMLQLSHTLWLIWRDTVTVGLRVLEMTSANRYPQQDGYSTVYSYRAYQGLVHIVSNFKRFWCLRKNRSFGLINFQISEHVPVPMHQPRVAKSKLTIRSRHAHMIKNSKASSRMRSVKVLKRLHNIEKHVLQHRNRTVVLPTTGAIAQQVFPQRLRVLPSPVYMNGTMQSENYMKEMVPIHQCDPISVAWVKESRTVPKHYRSVYIDGVKYSVSTVLSYISCGYSFFAFLWLGWRHCYGGEGTWQQWRPRA